jgi:hypothetical protein
MNHVGKELADMTAHPTSTIEIITMEDANLSRSGRTELVSKAIDISQLHERFKEFMTHLEEIIDVDVTRTSTFELDEIEFTAEITADGDFKLLGTGVGVEVNSGIKFRLKRKPSKQ